MDRQGITEELDHPGARNLLASATLLRLAYNGPPRRRASTRLRHGPLGHSRSMEIPKAQILELLRSRGDESRAQDADAQLPGTVDTDQHAGILESLGLSPQDLISQLGGGGLGGIAGKLGL